VIVSLESALRTQQNHDSILNDFWQMIGKAGTPLVERDTAGLSRVAFLWRGDSSTQNVVVITPFALQDIASSLLEHIAGTDVWVKTWLLRSDALWTYRFSVNDNLVPFEREQNFGARMSRMRADPLNSATFDFGAFGLASVFSLPDVPVDWSVERKGVARGKVDSLLVPYRAASEQRRVWVYTPPGYSPASHPYPPS